MRAHDVLVVVVSYNGLAKTKRSVNALRDQVGHIHIVDNGSATASLAILDELELEAGVSTSRLAENRGVGHALNLGVKQARLMGFSWLLTMDQDSVAAPNMVHEYQLAIERNPARVCLAPRIAGQRRDKEAERVVGYAITSGNLVQMSVFERVGLYDEELFIDSIDFDFCLRVRRAGYSVHRIGGAVMRHHVGEPEHVPRWLERYYTQHPTVRRYYMYRNFLYLSERYFWDFPAFIVKLAIAQTINAMLMAFLDPTPLKSYKAIIRGIGDYIMRRNGPYMEHV